MAGTIVSTPALGASDWSDWITQQGLTDRGFMRLSLTNFSGTAASQVAGGSIVEVAGSIYNFATAETITLATGTASASVAVYYNVIPSAGGTTCTVTMDSTVPVWSDAKQGFYASAASTTRVVGGAYINAAASIAHKFLYTKEYVDYCLRNEATRPLLERSTAIGEWNMDATESVTVQIECYRDYNIRTLSVTIFRDGSTVFYPLDMMYLATAGTLIHGGVFRSMGREALLYRRESGFFDGADFDGTASTMPNRGYVYYVFEA